MKLWSGRFTKQATSSSDEFGASIPFDQRLYQEDIAGSIAHARMLARQGILTQQEANAITDALRDILADTEAGKISFSIENEDIHMNIESLLTQRIGDVGKKLHTARSRNDQVAVDFKLWVRDAIDQLIGTEKDSAAIPALLSALIDLAQRHRETMMPGYTHLQRAQPVTFAYHLLAYVQMFRRDQSRFADCRARLNESPLGSGALAGTSYETDREFLAEELGFDRATTNAMDSVSDRDFALEFLSCCSICMMHLSRFCEELILWSSREFSFVEIDDAYATGSSIMPQKKNPDMAELIRGKTGRIYGDLFRLLTVMKGLPLAYNKDMQEDKEPVFDAFDTLFSSLSIFTEMITTMEVRTGNMEAAVKYGYMNATDAADYLVKKGIPFRDCHAIIGSLVLHCIQKGCAIEDLSLEELREFSEKFDVDLYAAIDPRACIEAKKSAGSTSSASVQEQLK